MGIHKSQVLERYLHSLKSFLVMVFLRGTEEFFFDNETNRGRQLITAPRLRKNALNHLLADILVIDSIDEQNKILFSLPINFLIEVKTVIVNLKQRPGGHGY